MLIQRRDLGKFDLYPAPAGRKYFACEIDGKWTSGLLQIIRRRSIRRGKPAAWVTGLASRIHRRFGPRFSVELVPPDGVEVARDHDGTPVEFTGDTLTLDGRGMAAFWVRTEVPADE